MDANHWHTEEQVHIDNIAEAKQFDRLLDRTNQWLQLYMILIGDVHLLGNSPSLNLYTKLVRHQLIVPFY